MSEQPDSQFEPLMRRPFALYPPIRNVEHNEWRFLRAAWSEILVANTKTNEEVWIPRRYVGGISAVEDPVVILGLERELELKAGSVWPFERRVIEMPRSVAEFLPPSPPEQKTRAPMLSGARAKIPSAESRISRLIVAAVVIGIAAFFVIVSVFREGGVRNVRLTAEDQDYLSLTRRDDILTVTQKLGPASEQRWRSDEGELQYCALWYPKRSYHVILMGSDRNGVRYVGALDRNWRLVHSVDLAGGGSTASLLRSLDKF